VDTKECLSIWASEGRGSLERCLNTAKISQKLLWMEDSYKWALKRLGLKYRHETFGERNAVEGFFSRLKERTKRFWNRFPYGSSFNYVQSWLESFMALYNYWRWLC